MKERKVMKFKILFLLLFISGSIFSQVTVEPEFATETDTITVTFDATEATRTDLVGYSGTLYTHTGVTTVTGNNSPAQWQHVIGSWGNNSNQPSWTRIGTDLYQLVIPNARSFYGVTNPAETITELNFVFRSADASRQTEDFFVPLFEDGLNVKLLTPTALPIYPEQNNEINISFTASEPDSLFLIFQDNIISQTTSDTLTHVINAEGTGRQWIIISAKKGEEVVSDSFYFFVREPVNIADLPAGVEHGINYINSTTVTFVLYAPNKEFVYMIGDFNNWEFDPEDEQLWQLSDNYYMNLTPDSTTYWKTISGLTPTQEFRFQYLVDGNLRIADPYADKILESEDSFIPESVYPNLIEYPSDKTSFSVSVFQTDQEEYQWEVTDFERPAKEELVIYELLVRDFVSTHSYQTLIDTLSYFETLGVNAIELMPIMEFEGNSSWGYNSAFMFAPDKYYGTKNDLKQFIDECHKRGIAVILDIVHNHHYGRSSFVRLYNQGDFGPPTSENPWFNTTSPNPVFSFGYDLNHEAQVTKDLIDRINRYWLEEYNIDGFRFDFTKGMTNTPGDGGSFDQARIEILKRMADEIWQFDSTAYVILEHFAPDTEERVLTDAGMMVWGNSNFNYSEATMGYHENGKSDFGRVSWKNHSGFSGPYVVGYMESHDEERLMYKNLQFGNSSGDYTTKDILTALQRMKMAATFFFTIPGPKLIWQFGELGYDFSIDYNGRVGEKPIRWDYFEDEARKKLYDVYAALINLRRDYDIFNTSDFDLSVGSTIKKIQLNSDSLNIMILGNFGVLEGGFRPSFQSTGMWYNFFTGDSMNISDPQAEIRLEPGEFHIYSDKKLTSVDPDIITDIENNNEIPNEFKLHQNYPNPFNPTTVISYQLSAVSDVKLTVFDILGRQIKTLVNQEQSPGVYNIEFNSAQLSSGIYFYRIEAGSFTDIKKMILLK